MKTPTIAWGIAAVVAAFCPLLSAPARAVDAVAPVQQPIQHWSGRLVDDVDWVAAVWDWKAADQASGRMLSLLVPLQDDLGRAVAKGPILIAGKMMADGSRRRVVLLSAKQVPTKRRGSARPFPPAGGAPAAPDAPAALYVIDDLAAIGAAELLKPALAVDAPVHPLADLLRQSSAATVGAFAFRPDAVKRWPAGLAILKDCKRGALILNSGKTTLTVDGILPMPAAAAADQAKSLTEAARTYTRTTLDATPPDMTALALTEVTAGVILWPAPATDAGAPESLRARLQLSPGALPGLLVNFISFPSARAALDANVLARQSGCRTLYLATLAPQLRPTGAGAFKPTDWDKPAAGVQFYLDTASQGADRAEYRLRVRDVKSKKQISDWQVNVARSDNGWRIDWAGPYVAKSP